MGQDAESLRTDLVVKGVVKSASTIVLRGTMRRSIQKKLIQEDHIGIQAKMAKRGRLIVVANTKED